MVIDPERNEGRKKAECVISADDSPVTVFVVPTNEELEIARQAVALI
jgi:acetate kinase